MLKQKIQAAQTFLSTHKKIVGLTLLAVILTSLTAVSLLRTQLSVKLDYRSANHRIDQAFEVSFGQELASIKDVSIYPEIDGTWEANRSLLGVNGIKFKPVSHFQTDVTYTVSITEASRLVTGEEVSIPDINFTTEQAPTIQFFSINDYSDKSLPADHIFKAELSSQNRSLRNLKLITKPSVQLDKSVDDDTVFLWKPKKVLPQGKTLEITLLDEKSGEILIEQKVKVVDEPTITQPVKKYNFGKDDEAIIKFNDPVDTATAQIDFSIKGSGEWKDSKTYVFKPEVVKPAKTYSYKIKAGLRTTTGGILRTDKNLKFSTPGVVKAASMSPWGSELNQAAQEIRFTLNQPVMKKTAESRFRISAGELKSLRWEGNTLIAYVENLGYQRTVTAWLEPGIKPIFGLASVTAQTVYFTTEIRVKKLDVIYYSQAFVQSCEAANVRMALHYRGINSTDWAILQKFGYNPTSRDTKNNIWDDPQKQFVGNVNGSQSAGTGWGVYSEPVAKAIRSFGRSATTHYGASPAFIASQIYKGRPVIVWGIWGASAKIDSWKTPEGKKIKGPIPMHVRLVVGVRGEPDNPVGFYINDPITGPIYWTAGQLAANMAAAGPGHQAVVVY